MREDGLEIRDARAEDFPAFAEIYNEAIASRRSSMDTLPVAPRYFAAYQGAEQALLAALRGQEILGWGVVKRYSERPGYRVACETSLYLRDAQTGRGYGGRLLCALVERAEALGYRHLVAKILGSNEASIRFHRRHGFELVGIQRRIGQLDGKWQDVAILQRIIDREAPGPSARSAP